MSPMKFEIHSTKPESHSTARRGTLYITNASHINENTPKRVIETPGCFMSSIKGSVQHLTPDNVRLQDFGGINVSLEQILHPDQPASFSSKWPSKSFSLADYLCLRDIILFCDLRDYSSISSSLLPTLPQTDSTTRKISPNTDRHVNLSTLKGTRPLTLDDYLSVVRQYRPDIMVAMADNFVESGVKSKENKNRDAVTESNTDSSSRVEADEKRTRKSIDRTLKWLDQILLERQGRDGRIEDRKAEEEKKRKKENKEKLKGVKQDPAVQDQQGQQPQIDSIKVQEVETEPWLDVALFAHVQGGQHDVERIRSATETSKRDVDGFLIDLGPYNNKNNNKEMRLAHIKTSVEHLQAQKPRMVYGIQAPEDVLKAVALGVDIFDTSYPYILTEEGKASLYYLGPNPNGHSSRSTPASPSDNNRWINLWDDEHSDKFVPILDGCGCYACKDGKHTRAYINHLLKAHEMLASVLLMSHNMFQYSRFFATVREAVKEGVLEKYTRDFTDKFGVEPVRTGEKHKAQIVVEEALTKRNQRLNIAESGVVDAIDPASKRGPDDENGVEKDIKKPKSDNVDL
ncbi:Queuine tRNA-ribosyltransferase subunit qtrtd1 [Entomortierella beljakovae]|nr:Queuine tRNA-ribosyltransferase subunit qtrtd1 [Entomortierella beljakovae]